MGEAVPKCLTEVPGYHWYVPAAAPLHGQCADSELGYFLTCLEGSVDAQVGRRPVAVSVGGGEHLAWSCHLFQGSGSRETESSQSCSERSELSANTESGPFQTRMEMYGVGVSRYRAVT